MWPCYVTRRLRILTSDPHRTSAAASTTPNGAILLLLPEPVRGMPATTVWPAASKGAVPRGWFVNARLDTVRQGTHHILLDDLVSLVPSVVSVVARIEVRLPG
jgi:hypothetical protein